MTWGPLVGSLRRWRRDDLYEQCSFHIAETMPSSVKVGVRPISAISRAYSSGFRPCATASFSSTLGSVSLKEPSRLSLERRNCAEIDPGSGDHNRPCHLWRSFLLRRPV